VPSWPKLLPPKPRPGIAQGDTANTTEINVALALQTYGIDTVDFETVWGLGHTMAQSGDLAAVTALYRRRRSRI
jgi:hypothetical protein